MHDDFLDEVSSHYRIGSDANQPASAAVGETNLAETGPRRATQISYKIRET